MAPLCLHFTLFANSKSMVHGPRIKGSTWKFVRNADLGPYPWPYWFTVSILTISPGESEHWCSISLCRLTQVLEHLYAFHPTSFSCFSYSLFSYFLISTSCSSVSNSAINTNFPSGPALPALVAISVFTGNSFLPNLQLPWNADDSHFYLSLQRLRLLFQLLSNSLSVLQCFKCSLSPTEPLSFPILHPTSLSGFLSLFF